MSFFLAPLIASGLGALGAGSIGGGALIIGPGLLNGITVGTLGIAGSISSALVTVGASVGLNAALGLLNKPKNTQQNSITIKQALPSRFIDFGRVKSGGCLVFFFSPDTNLYSVRIISCTKIQEIETLYMDDYATNGATLNTTFPLSAINGPWNGFVIAQARLGTDDQTYLDAVANAAWGVNHRLRGMACIGVTYIQGKKDTWSARFPNGPPNPTVVIKGAMVPDPRDGAHDLTDPNTWTYSDNAARCLLRWMLDVDGWGLSPDDLDLPSWQQACDDCDEDVATPSGTEKRYRTWGRYTTDTPRASTLGNFLAAMGGTLLEQPDGKLSLYVGVGHVPDASTDITDAHIRDVQLDRFPDALDRVDGIKARITWEGASWQEQEVPSVYSGASLYGAQADIEDLALAYCPSPYQAQRIAYATLKQRRAGWAGTIKTTLQGLRCYGEPTVRVTITELGIIGQVFEITGPPTLDTSDMTVTLSIRSYEAGTWDMPASEMGEMGTTDSTPAASGAPEPENLAVESISGGSVVTVTWGLLTDEDAYASEAQWREYSPSNGAEDNWTAATVDAAGGSAEFTVPGPSYYDFRARRITSRGAVSDWAILPEIDVT